MNCSLASLNGCLPRSIHFKLAKADAPASQRPRGLIFLKYPYQLAIKYSMRGYFFAIELNILGANFSRLDASYMGIDFVGRLLEQAGSPWRVSCGKRKKPANLAPSARDDDWISEIESID
ncbi:conserved hypothetical protein [Trichinella spiralis]|uniref:hypothetical protein n=1 Tax=Trichinella spiralis TaxID=6334 RepID=UPI0001EFBEB7|nr:conserved hypothetical protein [Trichinella spiralis]